MKKLIIVLLIASLLLCSSCEPGDKQRGFFGDDEEAGKTFIGGTSGVLMEFTEQRPPFDVFSGGDDPFDVEVELVNDGEYDVAPDDITVILTGIDPSEFGKTQQQFIAKPTDVLEGKKLDPDNNEIEGLPQYILYENLNHLEPVIGTLEYPIRIEACYAYGTNAISRLCYKEDQRQKGGVCEVNDEMETRSSGSPIQVSDITQSAVGTDSFSFSFTVSHKGNGQIYARGTCKDRSNENKVMVRIDTGVPGLTCSGLRDGQSDGEGIVDLRAGEAVIRCRQDVRSDIKGSFVKPVSIELMFNYKENIVTSVNVKQD